MADIIPLTETDLLALSIGDEIEYAGHWCAVTYVERIRSFTDVLVAYYSATGIDFPMIKVRSYITPGDDASRVRKGAQHSIAAE